MAARRCPLAALLAGFASWLSSPWWGPALALAMFLAGHATDAITPARLPAWASLPPREARLGLQIDRGVSPIDPRRVTGLATVTRADEHPRDLVGQRRYFSLTLKKGNPLPCAAPSSPPSACSQRSRAIRPPTRSTAISPVPA